MARAKRRSRLALTAIAILVVAGTLTAAFWPQPTLVDMATVGRGPIQVTIDEDGRTQVHEVYVVSTPVAGLLQRVTVEAGDPVTAREAVVAQMRPTNPAALDVRTREQALAAVDAAQAALRVAEADRNSAAAAHELAETDLDRARQLAESGTVSRAALERAETNARATEAALQTAEAAIAMRQAELANARAQLIGFEDQALSEAVGSGFEDSIPLHAPIDGRILRVVQESEAVLPAGAPVLEIGDIANGLDVVVDLISSDAVQVSLGDPVLIEDWGGSATLHGTVTRIAPSAVTKVSALGVEEQRVSVDVTFDTPAEERASLGHGFRVEARIVIWQAEDVLKVPSAALFRDAGGWAVFTVDDEGLARLALVDLGRNNGIEAHVLSGLAEGDRVILYPSAGLAAGDHVAPRDG
ncbi:MAG: HlyD family efflux transporter periplasmic adaptor subunit [Alphaproteobacteria bacterium]|jgi:HlyD family secretion protein|nr:HlyD family efflux transporter periplasmic adaptor subunit [Alphaproteobacteria bacterium]